MSSFTCPDSLDENCDEEEADDEEKSCGNEPLKKNVHFDPRLAFIPILNELEWFDDYLFARIPDATSLRFKALAARVESQIAWVFHPSVRYAAFSRTLLNIRPIVYEYGDRAHVKRLGKEKPIPSVTKLYDQIRKRIREIIRLADPKKSVYIAVDGVAPIAKQNQQRCRRFKAAYDRSKDSYRTNAFDSNAITAGTDFMKGICDDLKSANWNLARPKIVTISDDTEPGEGEHKIMERIRMYEDVSESYCVVGIDSDLIMLCLLSNKPKIAIMRGDNFIDIGMTRTNIKIPIPDFVAVCFAVGNDFLPSVPNLDIRSGALETLFASYDYLGTKIVTDEGVIDSNAVRRLFELVETGKTHEDRLVYNSVSFDGMAVDFACSEYVKGWQWVYSYYSTGVPSWSWYYPFHYAPHAYDICNYLKKNPFVEFEFAHDFPSCAVEQLMRILPPTSAYLIPEEFRASFLSLPTSFEIKYGKTEYDYLVIVDFVNVKL